jgi:hypothetical protein
MTKDLFVLVKNNPSTNSLDWPEFGKEIGQKMRSWIQGMSWVDPIVDIILNEGLILRAGMERDSLL